jgi:hypothetical protein
MNNYKNFLHFESQNKYNFLRFGLEGKPLLQGVRELKNIFEKLEKNLSDKSLELN